MKRGVLCLVLAVAGAGAAAAARGALAPPEGFPHGEHAGLFPTCLGCHQGVPDGDTAAFYSVAPEECAGCHDGEREAEVDWRGPTREPSNLTFGHPEHAAELVDAAERPLACQACHALPGAEARMAVDEARPAACLACHAHRAERHLVDATCSTCHLPLARAGSFPVAGIADFPAPPGHEEPSFLLEHADEARAADASCAVCHARESCSRCHLNAADVQAIEALAPDERVASLVRDEPGEWPRPPSHGRDDWWRAHGSAAREGIGTCANCHAAASCTACHGDAPPRVVARLPRPASGEPRGVRVDAVRPPGHDPDFLRNHGAAVAADLPSCASCHTEAECAACHLPAGASAARSPRGSADRPRAGARGPALLVHGGGGAAAAAGSTDVVGRTAGFAATRVGISTAPPAAASPAADTTDEREDAPGGGLGPWPGPGPPGEGFHPPDFVLRHGAEAFAAREECAECHAREASCRSCHEALGMAAVSRRSTGGAFHDAQPAWLISHGRAARQNMEACTSCHRQSSCLSCHSARSGLRVSPHGPGFDPERLADRSLQACSICHTRGQLSPP